MDTWIIVVVVLAAAHLVFIALGFYIQRGLSRGKLETKIVNHKIVVRRARKPKSGKAAIYDENDGLFEGDGLYDYVDGSDG